MRTRPSETASQTAGPYVHIGLAPRAAGIEGGPAPLGGDIAGPSAAGVRIAIEGTIRDGAGAPMADAVIEAWQANAAGIYASPDDPRAAEVEPGFRGWGRSACAPDTGLWRFDTVKPGRAPAAQGGLAAPHVALWIVARGVNLGLLTRLYFEDEAAANAEDPTLRALGPRAATLIARGAGDGLYRFDVRVQGPDETVFLDV